MKYSKAVIAKALFLSPLPLLLILASLFIILNSEFNLSSLFVVFVGHALVYLAYCIFIVPFSVLISILLDRYHALNLLSITLFSLLMAAIFFSIIGWGHTGALPDPTEWWKGFNDLPTLFMALFPGLCYWFFLIKLQARKMAKDKIN